MQLCVRSILPLVLMVHWQAEPMPESAPFDTSFAVEALTRAPHSVQEGLWSMLLEEGVQLDPSFWVT